MWEEQIANVDIIWILDAGPNFDMAVALGPNDGVLSLNGWMMPTIVIKNVKSRDMMVGRFWKNMNQSPPQ